MRRSKEPPAELPFDDALTLRRFTVADAPALARAVRESLEHLKPWMPWADEESASPEFQRARLAKAPDLGERGLEWTYGLFTTDGAVLGSFGMMTRRGPGTIELGYWLHPDALGKGYATEVCRVLTEVARRLPRIRRVLIYCDEANRRSAAVAERLGFRCVGTERRAREAPGEAGRTLVYCLARGQELAAERRA